MVMAADVSWVCPLPQKKLDDLFERGVVRSSELDDRTLDALDGETPVSLALVLPHIPIHV